MYSAASGAAAGLEALPQDAAGCCGEAVAAVRHRGGGGAAAPEARAVHCWVLLLLGVCWIEGKAGAGWLFVWVGTGGWWNPSENLLWFCAGFLSANGMCCLFAVCNQQQQEQTAGADRQHSSGLHTAVLPFLARLACVTKRTFMTELSIACINMSFSD